MPIRIAFVNGKGGVGKTTCATLIATALAQSSLSVSIEDRDPQGSATTAADIFSLPVGETGDIIIVDTAPNIHSTETQEAIRSADLVVLVTTPSPLDLATTAATAAKIKTLREGETRLLFNLVQTTNRFFREMPGIAKEIPFPMLKNFLTRRTAYQVAQLGGWKAMSPDQREETMRIAIEIAGELPK